jgi:outer membrane protein assembly factor BamD
MAGQYTGARLTTMRFVRRSSGALLLAALALASACASRSTKVPTGTPEPDKFLYERGSASLNERRWFTAREFFRQLVDAYPQSPFRADAKLGIADTYIGEGTAEGYVLAQNEFREFLAFYPTHRRAPYAQYKLGMTHFYQMRAAMRDQTETREAVKELSAFLEKYPNDELTSEVRQKLREAHDRLSESEYRVGLHYFRTKWYPGAVERFKGVLKNDPEYTHRDAVYFYLAESYMRVQRPPEALPLFEQLVKEFEKSEYLADAQKRIDEIKAQLPPEVKKGS